MTQISAALCSIINGKNNVCCLCLHSLRGKPTRLNDTVLLETNNDVAVGDMISSIFDEEMLNYLSTFDIICENCIKLIVGYYQFIQRSQRNAKHLRNILDGITNSFEFIVSELDNSKSLFVSFNPQDLTSKHYYDIKPLSNTKSALKRLQSLDNAAKLRSKDKMQHTRSKDDINYKESMLGNSTNIPAISHLQNKNNRRIVKCKYCCKEFISPFSLRNHYIRIHSTKKFKCPECSKSFSSAKFLKNHKDTSHCTIVCSECSKTFQNMHSLKLHELSHNLTLVCHDCGRKYKNKSTFQTHLKLNVCRQQTRAHPSDAKFTCDYCNKKYTQKVSLRVHIQYEHGSYKAHVCEWCGKKFWAQSRLKAHIVKHTREKKFSCTICDGRFVTKESLLYHTRTHTGEKPYKCSHCESQFLSASRRSEHVKRHHLGGTHQCDVCHCKFKSQLFLNKHKKTHTKSNDNLNFTAELKSINQKPNCEDQNKRILNINFIPDDSQDMMKIENLDDFHNAIESAGVEIQNFDHGYFGYEDAQQSSDDSVFESI